MSTTKARESLFGAPGDEWLDGDIHTAAERVLDRCYPDTPEEVVIEEWVVRDRLSIVPPARHIVERLIEGLADDYPHEGFIEDLPSDNDPALIEAAEALREALAARINFDLADKRVAKHRFRLLPAQKGQVAWRCDDLDVTISFPTR